MHDIQVVLLFDISHQITPHPSNKLVIGVGVQNSTSDPLTSDCDEFIFMKGAHMSDHKKKQPSNETPDNNISGKQTGCSDQIEAEEMVKYGITCVPVDYFHWAGYRYTNLQDAISQAKRTQ